LQYIKIYVYNIGHKNLIKSILAGMKATRHIINHKMKYNKVSILDRMLYTRRIFPIAKTIVYKLIRILGASVLY